LTVYQAHLYAFLKVNDLDVAATALAAKACASPIITIPEKNKTGIAGGFLSSFLEFFSKTPNLQNQISFLTDIRDVQDDIHLKRVKYGFRLQKINDVEKGFFHRAKQSVNLLISKISQLKTKREKY